MENSKKSPRFSYFVTLFHIFPVGCHKSMHTVTQLPEFITKSCKLWLLGKSGAKRKCFNQTIILIWLFTIIGLLCASKHTVVSVAYRAEEREEEKEDETRPRGWNGQNRKAPRWQSWAWGERQCNMLCFIETNRALQWCLHSFASVCPPLTANVMMLNKIMQWRMEEAPRSLLARSLRMHCWWQWIGNTG